MALSGIKGVADLLLIKIHKSRNRDRTVWASLLRIQISFSGQLYSPFPSGQVYTYRFLTQAVLMETSKTLISCGCPVSLQGPRKWEHNMGLDSGSSPLKYELTWRPPLSRSPLLWECAFLMEEEHPSSSFYKLIRLCLVGGKMYFLRFYSVLVRKWIEFSARSTCGTHAQKNFWGENVQ